MSQTNDRLFYLLLGRTGTQWSRADIDKETSGRAAKISYRELIASLDQIASLPLAAAYRTALTEQRDRVISQSFGDPDD